VSIEFSFLLEEVAAPETHVWVLCLVNATHVFLQMGQLKINKQNRQLKLQINYLKVSTNYLNKSSRWTQRTDERLFSSVAPHVQFQGSRVCETASTLCAGIWLFT